METRSLGAHDDWPPLTAPAERYKAIVAREWGLVRRVARRCGVPEGERDDIAVEVFLRYQKHVLEVTAPAAVRAWLRRATRLVAHEHFSAAASAREELSPADRLDAAGQVACVEEGYLEKERLLALLAHVEALRPSMREIFLAFAVEGLSIAQIGERCGLPPSTVWNRLRRVQEQLRGALRRDQVTAPVSALPPPASSGKGRPPARWRLSA